MDLTVRLLRRGQGQDEEAALALPGEVAERARNLACNVVVDFRLLFPMTLGDRSLGVGKV